LKRTHFFDLLRNFPASAGLTTSAMKNEEHDELWELLGRAKGPAVSPFFARNVVREVRAFSQEQPGLLGWLRAHWKAPVLAAGALAVVLAVGSRLVERPEGLSEDGQLLAMAQTVSESPDYHVIGHLDELLDSEENSIWLSADAY
jgi:hypothetical protein